MVRKEGTLRRRLRLIMLDFVLESVLLVVLVLDLGNRGHIEGGEMVTTVRITETYDMKTTVGKMGLVGIHTPQLALVRKLYPGLLKNHRFLRFVKCDVVGACASVLPADPLQVGVEEGKVAPEDMFNPILYTAVTNSSFDTIVARIRALSDVATLNSVKEGQMLPSWNEGGNFSAYYAFLAENGRYRKAMPQSGFSIKGLVPLAHTLISNYGNVAPYGNDLAVQPDELGGGEVAVPNMNVPDLDGDLATVDPDGSKAIFFRGKSIKMPKIPIHKVTTTLEGPDDIPYPSVPDIMVLAMILPPAKLHEFYYRMRVTWTVRFEQVCSTLEAGNWTAVSGVGAQSYGTNITYSSSKEKLVEDSDMVTVNDVELTKVMES